MDHSEGQKREPKRDSGPEHIGPYTIIAPLAIGEATSVFLAQKRGALGFQRMAAIKRLRAAYAKHPEWTQLLLDEARLSAGVHHANIVDIIDVGTDDGCYLVMEYIEGADLEMLLLRAGRERHARYVLPPIVDALHGLHAIHTAKDALGESLSMVHQAPGARHILIGIDGTARITDLSQVSARGLIPSTLRSERLKTAYMAPEQLLDSERVDARTDVFIVGITLWESLTGERLFEADVPELTRRAVLERHIPRPSEVGLRPPRCFDAICARALSRKPDQRYQSACEMARELRDVALSEALYANSSELGQWVRALAGRALLERRHALGADAPSIEMPLDLLEPAVPAGGGVRPTRSIPVAAPSSEAPRAHAPKPSAPTPSAPTPRHEPAQIATEDSRVARAMTVPVAAPPSPARVPPANFATAKSTLLGVSPRVVNEPAGPQVTAPPRGAPGYVPSVAREPAARDRRVNATLPEAGRTVPLSSFGAMQPIAAPAPQAEYGFSPHVSGPEYGDRGALACGNAPLERGPRPGAARSNHTGARDDSYERRVRAGRYDDSADSLRPASRGAHIDSSDWDELPSGGRSLGILSVVLVGIIVVAGVVGFKQWSQEGEGPAKRSAASAASGALPAAIEPPAAALDPAVRAAAAAVADAGTVDPSAASAAAPKPVDPKPSVADAKPTGGAPASGIRALPGANAAASASNVPPIARPDAPWKRKPPSSPTPTALPPSPRPAARAPATSGWPPPARPVDRAPEPGGLPSNPYE